MTSVLLLLGALIQDEDAILRSIQKLRSGETAERQAAEEAIRKAGARAVPVILRVLGDDPTGIRERVAAEVARFSGKEWKQRDEAMKALVRLGRHALKPLAEFENESDPEVAWRVRTVVAELRNREAQEEKEEQGRDLILVRILGELGEAASVPALLRALSSEGLDVRRAAAEALVGLRGHLVPAQIEEAAEQVLDLLPKSESAAERSLLIKALAAFRSASCARPLALLLRDRTERNVHLKATAVTALAAIGDRAAVQAIVETLDHDEPYLRHAAFRALSALAGEGFGYDPRLSAEENREAVVAFHAWWKKKFGPE